MSTSENLPLHFPVDIKSFQRSAPAFRQPTELTSFSYDVNRTLHLDDSELRYYFPPDLSTADLSHGYDTFIQRDATVLEHIDSLLDTLLHVRSKPTPGEEAATKSDFVTWRGIITKIMCTPYTQEEWELGATLCNGTIYLEEHMTEYKMKTQSGTSERHQLMTYWGYKFEGLSTIPRPPSQLLPDDPILQARRLEVVNTNVQYGTVVRTRLGKNTLILGAEVDCISDVKPPPPQSALSQYIELKTSRIITSRRDEGNFERRKLLKFWAQSFLIGTPTIICGFRDDDGFVKTVQTFKTLDIPRMVRGKNGMWDANVCLNFADSLLNWLREHVTVDDPRVTYTISWRQPWRGIELVYAGQTNAFLTERYLAKEMGPSA